MSMLDWIITIVPMLAVIWVGFFSRKYIKGVSDYLAAGRVAGRYVMCVAGVSQGAAVIALIGTVEAHYKAGFGMGFWNNILMPLSVFLGLTGFITYRFRETKAMSLGQFLEMRYNRPLRIYAAALRSVAELLANCMCPALAARFMIYYLGLPHVIQIFGFEIPTFLILTFIMVTMCVLICYLGGALALLVTDTIQGFICYPLLVIFIIFIISKFSWSEHIIPVMADRVAGQSFLNPYDIAHLRDFNMFALVVTVYSTIVHRGDWIGAAGSVSARSPHEQKMAGILGTWSYMFVYILYTVLIFVLIAVLNHPAFAVQAKDIRDELSERVIGELPVESPQLRQKLIAEVKSLPPRDHIIGGDRPQDAPLSHDFNMDTAHLQTVHNGLKGTKDGEAVYQQFFTLYHQMMLATTMRHMLPIGLLGLFALFILLMMLSTDDSRLFSAAQTIVQDCVVPFMKKGFSTETHVFLIRLISIGCGLVWFIGSFFMAQLDYVNMFVTIVCSLMIGLGPVVFFGLYSRFGNTVGAFCSMLTGMVLALFFIFCQRNWADLIYPWLEANNWHIPVGKFLEACSHPFEPWIKWRMASHKFPINSMEINFIIMISCLIVYITGSLITYRKPFNLDRMLHRGIYDTDGDKQPPFHWSFKNVFKILLGITPEYTRGDKVIAWAAFIYSIIYKFLICFILVVIWNAISPWKPAWWGHYYFVVCLGVPLVSAFLTSVWFIIGGVIDVRRLFRDLAARVDNPLDNGQVEGHVALSDIATFSKLQEGQTNSEGGASSPAEEQK